MVVRDLTEDAVRELVLANMKITQSQTRKLNALAMSAIGYEVPEMGVEEQLLTDKLNEAVARAIAHRLLIDDRGVDLVRAEDLEPIITEALESEFVREGGEFDEIREEITEFVSTRLNAFLVSYREAFTAMQGDPYESLWERLEVVQELCLEYGVFPDDLSALEGVVDEFTRRTVSRDELATRIDAIMGNFMNVDWFKETFVDPQMQAYAKLTGEDLDVLEREFEDEVRDELVKEFEAFKGAIVEVVNSEIDRIYA